MDHPDSIIKPILEDPVANPHVFFAAHRKLLEDLFEGPTRFENASGKFRIHPAVQRWKLCRRLEQTGHFLVDESTAVLIGSIILDGHALARCTEGDPTKFKLGDLSNYGDNAVVARIRGGLPDRQQFISIISEITCAAWLYAEGYVVTPSAELGKADLHISARSGREEMLIEVKSAPLTTSKNSIHKRLRRANVQLKSGPNQICGIALLDLSPSITTRMRGDAIPPEVVEVTNWVSRMFQVGYSGVSAALISWRDFQIARSLRLLAHFSMRRRSILVRNTGAIVPLPANAPLEQYGDTLVFEIDGRVPLLVDVGWRSVYPV